MSQTILEKSQGEFNKIRNDEVGKGINAARDLGETYARQILEEKQRWSKVTIQAEPIDPVILAGEIKGAIENADRPEAGQVRNMQNDANSNITERNPNLELGTVYTISDMQAYANQRRQLERQAYVSNREQSAQEPHHVAEPEQNGSNNVVVRREDVRETENELG